MFVFFNLFDFNSGDVIGEMVGLTFYEWCFVISVLDMALDFVNVG